MICGLVIHDFVFAISFLWNNYDAFVIRGFLYSSLLLTKIKLLKHIQAVVKLNKTTKNQA